MLEVIASTKEQEKTIRCTGIGKKCKIISIWDNKTLEKFMRVNV